MWSGVCLSQTARGSCEMRFDWMSFQSGRNSSNRWFQHSTVYYKVKQNIKVCLLFERCDDWRLYSKECCKISLQTLILFANLLFWLLKIKQKVLHSVAKSFRVITYTFSCCCSSFTMPFFYLFAWWISSQSLTRERIIPQCQWQTFTVASTLYISAVVQIKTGHFAAVGFLPWHRWAILGWPGSVLFLYVQLLFFQLIWGLSNTAT